MNDRDNDIIGAFFANTQTAFVLKGYEDAVKYMPAAARHVVLCDKLYTYVDYKGKVSGVIFGIGKASFCATTEGDIDLISVG